jgi:DNA-binding CsgD family transcriptional regulator
MALLERDAYLRDLHESLDRVTRGQGELVFLGGEAGIGKTSLIAQFVDDVSARARTAIVSCDGDGLPGPLGPLFDLAEALGPEVAGLLDEEAPREAIFRAVLRVFRSLDAPLVMVGEDAHWVDEATLELVRFLGRRIASTKVLFIVAYRDDELAPYHPLRRVLGDLSTAPGVRRVHLPPLSRDAVATLAAGARIDPDALYERTAGNSFFITETIEAGAAGLPATVRDAVLARAARLSPEGRSLLDAAAICGPTVDPDVLTAVIGDPMASAVDECIDVGMLRHVDRTLAFRHAISRDAILSTISLPRRRALHRRVLETMQRDPDLASEVAQLAFHAEEADDGPAALAYATAAARRATAFGAHREAAAQYGRALRFADQLPVGERLPLMAARSYECYLTGDLAQAITVQRETVDLWAAAGDRRRQGDALRWLSRFFWFAGQTEDAYRAAQEAHALLAALEPGPELAMACSNLSQLHMLKRELPAAIAWGEQAMALATALGDDAILVHALTNVGTARYTAGERAGRDMLERAVALARPLGLDDDITRAMTNLGWTAWQHRELARAERYLDEAVAYSAERDLVAMELYQRASLASVRLCRSQWRAAREEAESLAQSPGAIAATRIVALTCLARAKAIMNEDATEMLVEAQALAEQTGELQRLGPVAVARAEAAWLAGDPACVVDAASAMFEAARTREDRWLAGELGLWLHRANVEVDPRGLAEPYAREIAGDHTTAALWTELGYPLEAARARASSGTEVDLREALAEFERIGARADALRVTRLLRTMGVRGIPRGPRPATRANAANLTVRELDVLLLLAEGASDRAIADRLFLSAKTVGHHVSSILAKLDVPSRDEAARQARALGVLQSGESPTPK